MKVNDSWHVPSVILPFVASLFIVVAYNSAFWRSFVGATGGFGGAQLPLQIGAFFSIVLIFTACLTLVNFERVIKPVLILLFIATSAASYFMNQYGTAIDWSMIQNVVETDAREGMDLFTWKMVFTVALLGILPSVALARTRIHYPPIRRHLVQIGITILFSLVLVTAILLIFYKGLAPTLREHRELRFLLTPTNYLQAINGYFKRKWSVPPIISALGKDAKKGGLWVGNNRRTVTVIIVGETARAMNFSLNGYPRKTNPLLSQQTGLVNFSNVQSCGTATAVSLPCVFSALGRDDYSDAKGQSQEGLLDVIKHAGFDVRWLDNNSGCKGVCDRVQYADLSQPNGAGSLCNGEECYDAILLRDLPDIIRNATNDLVIVLHQKGSHGPSYWKRYPPAFAKFGPVCKTNELTKCSRESIVAAYDNTILYTDFIIRGAIEILERSNKEMAVDTALLYFSDHGESLGERNMYLHGTPYFISPLEQRHVPLMLWTSPDFRSRFRMAAQCLEAKKNFEFSHDNIFHSTLGMLNITTVAYKPALDIFRECMVVK